MNIGGVDTAIKRIEEIEKRFDSLFDSQTQDAVSAGSTFGDILQNKLEINSYSNKDESGLPNTTELPDVPAMPKGEIFGLIDKYAEKNKLDKNLVKAVVQAESGFNSKAKSPVGALGLMQLMPSTAAGLGVKNPLDAEQNIAGGTKYLKNLINKYDSVKLGLAAYNAGPNAVNKYGGVPPYKETQNYVKKIMNNAQATQ